MPTEKWRVGSQIPLNVYCGDRAVCQCHNAEDAAAIVAAMNGTAAREPVIMRNQHSDPQPGDVLMYQGKTPYRVVRLEGRWIVDTPVNAGHPDFGEDLYHTKEEWALFFPASEWSGEKT